MNPGSKQDLQVPAPSRTQNPNDSSLPTSETPRVWVLISNKTGDDNQSILLAKTLGSPFAVKKMVFAREPRLPLLDNIFGPSLSALDLQQSDPLEPPWPDLAISAGRRQEAVMRWLKRRSGGRTRLVQFNRPKALAEFDLVIVPPQLLVPPRSNVYTMRLPLHRADDEAGLEQAGKDWAPRLGDRPRPWLMAMVGGSAWPFIVNAEVADRLMVELQAYADSQGGALFVTTSPRTPPDAIAALRAAARPQDFLYVWSPDQSANPFKGLLQLCDEFVVTCDSVSMPTQVVRLQKPLAIYRLPERWALRKKYKTFFRETIHRDQGGTLGNLVSSAASWIGIGYTRDFMAFYDSLVADGWASYFGDPIRPPRMQPPDDLAEVTARVRSILDDPGS